MVRRPAADDAPADDEVPRFFWDRSVTAGQLRAVLGDREDDRRLRLLAAMLREARPDEVWAFVSPEVVAEELPRLGPLLGRQREFWEWLIAGWRQRGFLAG